MTNGNAPGEWKFSAPQKFQSLARLVYQHIAAVTWPAIILIAAIHFFSSWTALLLVEGEKIAAVDVFWYFYLVTATTVGYGDFAPMTGAGRAIAVFWIMPGGIAIFTSIVAKVVQSATGYWRRRMLGLGDYRTLKNHTVIMGWNGESTRKMVAFMRGDQPNRDIVLVSYRVSENPMPDQVHFVRGESLSSLDVLERSGIAAAGRAVITGHDDNETLAVCLAVSAHSRSTHLAAFFQDEAIADLLKAHCPAAECLVPMSTELLVRTADDPGSSRVPKILLSTLISPTLYSLRVPEEGSAACFGDLFLAFYQQHRATLLGVASGRAADEIFLNPPGDRIVMGGETLYYIAEHRLAVESIAWASIALGND